MLGTLLHQLFRCFGLDREVTSIPRSRQLIDFAVEMPPDRQMTTRNLNCRPLNMAIIHRLARGGAHILWEKRGAIYTICFHATAQRGNAKMVCIAPDLSPVFRGYFRRPMAFSSIESPSATASPPTRQQRTNLVKGFINAGIMTELVSAPARAPSTRRCRSSSLALANAMPPPTVPATAPTRTKAATIKPTGGPQDSSKTLGDMEFIDVTMRCA